MDKILLMGEGGEIGENFLLAKISGPCGATDWYARNCTGTTHLLN